jgi:hypothetical protein
MVAIARAAIAPSDTGRATRLRPLVRAGLAAATPAREPDVSPTPETGLGGKTGLGCGESCLGCKSISTSAAAAGAAAA